MLGEPSRDAPRPARARAAESSWTCRNYVTQDVLRRIMQDYFGYDVHFVMNVTDIDDKVSERTRYALVRPLHCSP